MYLDIFETDTQVGIYIIENIKTGQFYIGQTNRLRERFNDHSCRLRLGIHANQHLQRAYHKHGPEQFVMFMMQTVDDEIKLDQIEQEWVDAFYDNCKRCYNIKSIAHKPPLRKGCKLTPEQIQKWSDVKKGKRFTEEHKRKIGLSKIGKKRTFTTKWVKNLIQGRCKPHNVKVISPAGEIYGPITNLNEFCRDHQLVSQNFGSLLKGKIKQHKGWRLLNAG